MGKVKLTPAKPLPATPSSEEILKEFLDSGLERAELDHDELGRKVSAVYVALRSYLRKHSEYQVTVGIQNGHVVLEKVL